jgi:hypothetical protein
MTDSLPSEGRYSFRSHRCEWKNGPDDSVYVMTLFFLCRLISNDMILMATVCLWTVDVFYYGGCVPMIMTMCH